MGQHAHCGLVCNVLRLSPPQANSTPGTRDNKQRLLTLPTPQGDSLLRTTGPHTRKNTTGALPVWGAEGVPFLSATQVQPAQHLACSLTLSVPSKAQAHQTQNFQEQDRFLICL